MFIVAEVLTREEFDKVREQLQFALESGKIPANSLKDFRIDCYYTDSGDRFRISAEDYLEEFNIRDFILEIRD